MIEWFKNTNEPAQSWFETAGNSTKTVFWVVVAVLVAWILRPLLVAVTRK